MNLAELTVIQRAVLNHFPTLNLPSGARILDAPCGGPASLNLTLRERGFRAVGSDGSDAEIDEALFLRFSSGRISCRSQENYIFTGK